MKVNRPYREANRKKWWVRWSNEHGDRCKRSFDRHADAEHFISVETARIREVKKGLQLPTPPTKRMSELLDYWLANRASQKRSKHHDESIIRAHLRKAFGHLLVTELSLPVIDKFICDLLLKLDKKTVANILTLLISVLNMAVELGWLLRVPRIRKPKIQIFSQDYRYLRSREEIQRFLRAAFEQGPLVGVLYATAIYTGLRLGELAALRWDKIDFEKRIIVVDHSFNGPTKSGAVRYVPILDPLLPILKQWRLQCPGRIVFPNREGKMHEPSARIFQETLHKILEAADFPVAEQGSKKKHYLTFHGLRHSFASHWVMGGGDLYRLQRILGHKSITMTQRYAHLAPAVFSSDYARLGDAPVQLGGTVVAMNAP